MKFKLIAFVVILATPFSAIAQTISSLDGYDNLLSIELKSGDLSIYETPKGSNLAILIEMKNAPLCKSEVVANPVRVLIDCPGRILQGTKPIKLTKSKMAKQVRFGNAGDSSKIVIDMNVDVFPVQSTKQTGDRSLLVFGGKGKDWSTPEPTVAVITIPKEGVEVSATATATPKPAATVSLKEDADTGPVFTPVPLPKIAYGETDLNAVAFDKDLETNSPIVKIGLGAARKVELKKQGPLKYVMKIDAARVYSPIFLNPQVPPADFAPFRQVLVSEVIEKNSPVGLSVQIDLVQPAELQVKQSAGQIEVFLGSGAEENEQ